MPDAAKARLWTPQPERYAGAERPGQPDGSGRLFFERTGRDPKEQPIRLCPIHEREIWARECATICGKQFVQECKFADRDPRPEEMLTTRPIMVAEEDEAWVRKWHKEHGPALRRGQTRPK